jgi:hypothetical protein
VVSNIDRLVLSCEELLQREHIVHTRVIGGDGQPRSGGRGGQAAVRIDPFARPSKPPVSVEVSEPEAPAEELAAEATPEAAEEAADAVTEPAESEVDATPDA